MYNELNMGMMNLDAGVQPEMLLKVSNLASQPGNWKRKIDQIIQVIRPWFVFDNFVVYTGETPDSSLEVLYARATGRGKFSGAEITWGENVANQVIRENKTILDKPVQPDLQDRLQSPLVLGLSLPVSKSIKGALILIRFGGPEFLDEGITYAEFIASQILNIIRQKSIEDVEIKLEMQQTLSILEEDFLNSISHELRSPLGFIKGYTTTLLREDTSWDQVTQRDFLEIIERETNNLSRLIDDLLDSSRLQSGQLSMDFQDVALDSLIRDEVSRSAINHPEQKVSLDFQTKLPHIFADPRRLAQVFDNLLNNSLKYAPGAKIRISAKTEDEKMVILFGDEGPGINSKYLPLIFSKFFRDPDNSGKARGSGLGLSICKEIITLHNGEISASSPPGSGAIFKIILPIGSH
jgi:signal transduction histidine kinase